MSLTPLQNGITIDQLDSWGSVTDLGSEIWHQQGQISHDLPVQRAGHLVERRTAADR